MKPPKTVSTGPHTYPVTWHKDRISHEGLLGLANREEGEVEVSLDQSVTGQKITFIHEFVHMVFWNSAMRHAAGWTEEMEEMVITSIEDGLAELFTRPENLRARAWLIH